MNYTPIIGLEVHVELKTKSKMFCSCSASYFGSTPNTHCCPVCLGLPGALPVPNKTAIDWCINIAQALGCEIPLFAKFDRKNYFYPDLAKGYQISQADQPFGINGKLTLKNGKTIRIQRVHMEEDTGKLTHEQGTSLIDFNRSGVPLVEIVTAPDFSNAQDVKEYLQTLQQIVRYLDVSNADMEKGDMRLEPNISLQKEGETQLPSYKVEVKNINSFRFVEKAVLFEIQRQQALLEKGETPAQETRGWDEKKQQTVSQRLKEEANDYRYFPEPDIPPFHSTKEYIQQLKDSLPELPGEKRERFMKDFGLSAYDSDLVTREKEIALYFEEAVQEGKKQNVSAKQIANVIINKKIQPQAITVSDLVQQIASESQKETIDEQTLQQSMNEVLSRNEKVVADYKAGKEQAIMFLLGQTLKAIGKKVDAEIVKQALITTLSKG